MTTVNRFYGRVQWTRVRSNILRRDEYMCRECRRFGRTTEATHVHHIFPIETHWELRTNRDNLVSLCNVCHEKMHNRITNEITKVGNQWQEKIKNKIISDSPPLNCVGKKNNRSEEGRQFQ